MSSASDKDNPEKHSKTVNAEDGAILSQADIEQIREKARKTVLAEMKKSAAAALLEQEIVNARREMGFQTDDDRKNEMVFCTIDLAEHSTCISINSFNYWHGQTYKVPRHVADTLAEIMARGHRHQDELDGKSLRQHYQKPRADVISGKAVN